MQTTYSLSVSLYNGLTLTTTVSGGVVMIEKYSEFASLSEAEHHIHQNIKDDKELSLNNKVVYTDERGEISRDDFIARIRQIAAYKRA